MLASIWGCYVGVIGSHCWNNNCRRSQRRRHGRFISFWGGWRTIILRGLCWRGQVVRSKVSFWAWSWRDLWGRSSICVVILHQVFRFDQGCQFLNKIVLLIMIIWPWNRRRTSFLYSVIVFVAVKVNHCMSCHIILVIRIRYPKIGYLGCWQKPGLGKLNKTLFDFWVKNIFGIGFQSFAEPSTSYVELIWMVMKYAIAN